MKKYLILLSVMFEVFYVYGQICEVDNLRFSSQAQIDAFPSASNGCKVIIGNIYIDEAPGERITNLSGLAHIECIRGNFEILGNRALKDLGDLISLDSIYGNFDLRGNDSLVSITGVNELKFIGQRIYIENNFMLAEFGEFNNIDSINNLHLHLRGVKEFNAFPNLSKVHLLILGENSLKDLTGFSALKEVKDLSISKGDSLLSLHGLENISVLNSLLIKENPLLTNFHGLGPLDTIYYGLQIENNSILSSIDILENTFSNTMHFIRIKNNTNLSFCHYDIICEALTKVHVEYEIEGNAMGCQNYYHVAKNCKLECPTNIHFKTQGEIDSFPIIFPQCNFVPGGIRIWYGDVTNVDSLYRLTGIGNYLTIGVSEIKSISGLRNLNFIGQSLIIEHCDSLKNLNGLEGITSIHQLKLDKNVNLSDMSGLSNLIEVGSLSLNNSPIINGFDNLQTASGLYISGYREDILEFTFPPKLHTVHFEMAVSDIDSLDIFPDASNLRYVGSLDIARTNFKSLEGLSGLDTIDGYLQIVDNPFLSSLDGFRNVKCLKGRLGIDRNVTLTNISGLSNIDPDSLDTYWQLPVISITDNLSLSECDIVPVCQKLSENFDLVLIDGNSTGCYTEEEVINECLVNADDINEIELFIYPNPSEGELNIGGNDNLNFEGQHVIIYNQMGRIVEIADYSSTLNLTNLVDGLYYLIFITEDNKLFSSRLIINKAGK